MKLISRLHFSIQTDRFHCLNFCFLLLLTGALCREPRWGSEAQFDTYLIFWPTGIFFHFNGAQNWLSKHTKTDCDKDTLFWHKIEVDGDLGRMFRDGSCRKIRSWKTTKWQFTLPIFPKSAIMIRICVFWNREKFSLKVIYRCKQSIRTFMEETKTAFIWKKNTFWIVAYCCNFFNDFHFNRGTKVIIFEVE